MQGHIYFHSPCFDGIASAVLISDFLEAAWNWHSPALQVVNYDLRDTWLNQNLEKPCAVVDFLYHPQADFWADHHLTAFANQAALVSFRARRSPSLVYDDKSGSCAKLLWNHLFETFRHRNHQYADIVTWADKIDSARYESVEEAILCPAPALKISLGLALIDQNGYCRSLVEMLRTKTLSEIAEAQSVKERFEQAQSLMRIGLERFKQHSHLEYDGIVVFDVNATDAFISRYAPYYFYPHAFYSVGIVRWQDTAKITAMRNPWREFESVPLGAFFEQIGGGGHYRVASVVLRGPDTAKAPFLIQRILSFIRQGTAEIKIHQKA